MKRSVVLGAVRDAISLAGAGLIVYGVYQVAPPLAYIVAGGMLLAARIGVAATRKPGVK